MSLTRIAYITINDKISSTLITQILQNALKKGFFFFDSELRLLLSNDALEKFLSPMPEELEDGGPYIDAIFKDGRFRFKIVEYDEKTYICLDPEHELWIKIIDQEPVLDLVTRDKQTLPYSFYCLGNILKEHYIMIKIELNCNGMYEEKLQALIRAAFLHNINIEHASVNFTIKDYADLCNILIQKMHDEKSISFNAVSPEASLQCLLTASHEECFLILTPTCGEDNYDLRLSIKTALDICSYLQIIRITNE